MGLSRLVPRLVGIPAAALVVALAISGCGSAAGDGESAESPPRLTRAQLAKRMGDICQEHTDRQVIAVERFEKERGIPLEGTTAPQSEQELTQVILPIVHDTIHDIGRLRPPVKEEAGFEAFIAALEHGVMVSERDPSWLATGNSEPFMRARETSAALGTYYCGQA